MKALGSNTLKARPGLRKFKLLFIFLLFIIAFYCPGQPDAMEMAAKEIRIQGLDSIEEEELVYLLGIEPGSPYADEDVTRGIKRLYLKGIFENIAVERDDAEEGVVHVRVKEHEAIDDIAFTGYKHLSRRFIKRWMPLKEGMVVTGPDLEDAGKSLEAAIWKRGYPGSTVTISSTKSKKPNRVRLLVDIEEKDPVHVESIRLIGRSEYPERFIKRKMKIREGVVYDQFRLERDIERIERFLRKKGHIKPEIGPYTFSEGQLLIGVRPGIKLKVEIEGNSAISSRSIRSAMPFSETGEVNDGLIGEAVSRIQDIYRKNKFSETHVAPVLSGDKDDLTIRFFIHEGSPSRINEITISSKEVPSKKIKELMRLKQRGRFSPILLDQDLQRIKEFYLALGYMDIVLRKPVVVKDEKRVNIFIEIEEGKKVTYGSIKVETAGSILEKEMGPALMISPGEPYNEVDITETRRKVLSLCRNHGHYFCEVEVSREFSEQNVDVTFHVIEGDVFFFGKTVIRGNKRTKRRVITRNLLYSEGDLLNSDLLMKSRQRLYRLGLFRSVDFEPMDSDEDEMDLLLNVDESMPGAVTFGFGYGEYERYRGFIDVSYANLFGMNRRGTFRTEQSTLWSRYILNYQEPSLFGTELISTTVLLYEKRKEKNIDTDEISYRIERLSASTGIEKNFTERVKGTINYSYSIVRTYDVQPDVILTRDDTGTLAISSLSPGLLYDSRDNIFDPRKGVLTGMTIKWSSESISSETNFVKGTAQAGFFYPATNSLVLATSFRGGMASAYGEETSDLPLVERFFLGGRNTVRGYKHDGLGPTGIAGTPIGGNAFVLWNLELRCRVTGNWRIVPFVDAGNVWIETGEANMDDLRYTAGVGLQYNTPVGPLRVDYGKKLETVEGQSREEIHFSIGHAF
jgi:outer membrane protein insertion porin family